MGRGVNDIIERAIDGKIQAPGYNQRKTYPVNSARIRVTRAIVTCEEGFKTTEEGCGKFSPCFSFLREIYSQLNGVVIIKTLRFVSGTKILNHHARFWRFNLFTYDQSIKHHKTFFTYQNVSTLLQCSNSKFVSGKGRVMLKC